MNQSPLVSAIITTHNRLDLLRRAIDSVLSQTYNNMECIVVSDNSTDGTNEYCEATSGIRFISIPKEESKGGNHARNVGILSSKGEYVAFLDDDDYWLPTKIEKQLAQAIETKCALISCPRYYEIISENGMTHMEEELLRDNLCGDWSRKILYTSYAVTSTLMINKEVLNKIGLFDENLRYWQDCELLIRMAQVSDFSCINESLCVCRTDRNDKNRLTNHYYEWLESVQYIHEKHKELYSALHINEKRKLRFYTLRAAYIRADHCGLEKEKKRLMQNIKIWGIPEIIKDKFKLVKSKS